MAKYLVIIFTLIFYGCEINSQQLVKQDTFKFQEIKFNTVSKELILDETHEALEGQLTQKLLIKWFDNYIKTDGFEGHLTVDIKEIKIKKIKKDNYYKFEINLNINFSETNNILKSKKTYKLNAKEYGEINGSFSIKDQDNLSTNIINKCIQAINIKLLSL